MGQFDGSLRESLCWVNNLPESKKLKQRKKKTLPASNISENHETIEWSKSLCQDRWKQGVLEDTT